MMDDSGAPSQELPIFHVIVPLSVLADRKLLRWSAGAIHHDQLHRRFAACPSPERNAGPDQLGALGVSSFFHLPSLRFPVWSEFSKVSFLRACSSILRVQMALRPRRVSADGDCVPSIQSPHRLE